MVTFLNLEADICFSSARVWVAADTSDSSSDFGLIASANRPANLHFPGDDLAEDATKKQCWEQKWQKQSKTKEKKIVERDDILKCLEYSTERLKGPSGLSRVLTNKFNGQEAASQSMMN